MSYTMFSKFQTDYEASPYRGKAGAGMEAPQAWNLYLKAKQPALRMSVLGRHINDPKAKDGLGIKWFEGGGLTPNSKSATGVSGADHVAENFGVVAETNPSPEDKFDGSILAVNDTWVLAGIHGRLPFYCASPMTLDNLADDKYAITITGREVVGLLAFGHHYTFHTTTGGAFTPLRYDLSAKANFANYKAALDKLDTAKAAREFFTEHGLNK